jgi:very-short-patch-repair endonuclease
MAAVLACGAGAVLSHRTAAAALGVLPATAKIDVTAPNRSGRRRPGIAIHRAPGLTPADTTTVDRIPCTSLARTLLDLAAVVSAAELLRAIEAAERLRMFDLKAINEHLERAPSHPGTRCLRAALAAYTGEPPPTRLDFERLAFHVLNQRRLGRPRVNVLIDTAQEQLEVDFCWPDRRLIVEADSWEFHRTRASFERDRRRDQLLTAAGWTVIRITWRQLTESPEEVIAAVAGAAIGSPAWARELHMSRAPSPGSSC